MKLTEKFAKNRYIVLWPVLIFIILVAVCIGVYGKRLRQDEMTLLQGRVVGAADIYGAKIEAQLKTIEGQMELVIWQIREKQLDAEDAVSSLLGLDGVSDAGIVNALGVGLTVSQKDINLPALGFSGTVKRESATFFYSGDGRLYIMKPILENGEVNTAVLVEYDAEVLYRQLEAYTLDDNAWVVLQDTGGNIICSLGGDNIDYLQAGSNFMDTLSAAGGRASAVRNGLQRQRSAGAQVIFPDGDSRYVAYHHMKNNGWAVLLGVDDAYFAEKISHYSGTIRRFILSLSGCMVIFMGVVIFLQVMYNHYGKRKSAGLQYLAETDQLTGLYNKVTTERKIKEYFAENPDTQSLLFVLDIDNYKKINDTMGHAFGDEVLREIGQGLKQQFRASDIIGRAGGDEFVILLKHITEDQYVIREAQKLENFFKGLQVGKYTKYSVTSSIGCAVFTKDGEDFETLYKMADEALYKAKQRGKNQLAFYKDPEGFGQNV